MEALVDDRMDAEERGKMAKSIASLQRAQVSNEKLKLQSRKERGAVHVAMEMLKDKVFAEIAEGHPEIADALMQLADETEKEMQKMQ